MAEFSGFFNSAPDDIREYQAKEFAEYFSRFLSDGIYSKDNRLGLKVSAETGFNIKVETGFAYIRGHMYKNDSVLNKTIEPADSMLNRIDRVVLRFDEIAREITVRVKTGAFSSNPAPPELEDTTAVKELSLAQVRINKDANSVIVTDERLSDKCGQVKLLVDVPLDDLRDEIELWKANNQSDYDAWLADLQDLLDENVAGNLLALIEAIPRVWSGDVEPVDIVKGDHWLREVV